MGNKNITRKDRTLEEKLKLLKRYDELNLSLVPQRDAAAKLGMPQGTLSKLLKSRHTLEANFDCPAAGRRKRKREGKNPMVDEALFSWFQQESASNPRLNCGVLLQKANDLAKEMKLEFIATSGWLSRWKDRHGIGNKKAHREKQDSVVENWMKHTWELILEKYKPGDIFNIDETALYYRSVSDSLNLEASSCSKIKDQITVLLTYNMTGTVKKTPLVIGKSKPECFMGVKNLPTDYKSNKSAWITSLIFGEYLKNWNLHLQKSSKKIALLLDNLPSHPDLKLSNIEMFFIPPNIMHLLQPLDQSVIKIWKTLYRKEMRQRLITEFDENPKHISEIANKISVLDALHMTKSAWSQVSEKCIQNFFAKFNRLNEYHLLSHSDEQENVDEEFEDWINLYERIGTFRPVIENDMNHEIQKDVDKSSEIVVNDEKESTDHSSEIDINNEFEKGVDLNSQIAINSEIKKEAPNSNKMDVTNEIKEETVCISDIIVKNNENISEQDFQPVTKRQAMDALHTIKKVIEENGRDCKDFDTFYELEKTIFSYYVNTDAIQNKIVSIQDEITKCLLNNR